MVAAVESEALSHAWSRLQSGPDEYAFAELFRRHNKAVYNYCFRRIGSWAAAEDATQATFTTLWRRVRQHRIEQIRNGSELAILLGIARHECLTITRSRQRRYRLTAKLESQPASSPPPAQDHWVAAETTMQAINDALAQLNRGQRDVIELVYWADLSIDEAATALGVAVGTVKSRLSRARAALAASELLDLLVGAR